MKMKQFSKILKTIAAVIGIVTISVCTFVGCAGENDYTFEAEDAVITDGDSMWPAVNEAGVNVAGKEPEYCPGISNISDGATIAWTITADKAAEATLTIHVGCHLRDWGTMPAVSMGIEDLSKAMEVTVNGAAVAISGSIPQGATLPEDAEGGTAYNIVEVKVNINLTQGENTIVCGALGTGETSNLFFDKIVVNTSANLTFTKTDNSERVWQAM